MCPPTTGENVVVAGIPFDPSPGRLPPDLSIVRRNTQAGAERRDLIRELFFTLTSMIKSENAVEYVYDLRDEAPLDLATYILPAYRVRVLEQFWTVAEVDLGRDGRVVIPLPPELAAELELGYKRLRFITKPSIPEPSTGRDRTVTDIRIEMVEK